MMRPIIASPSCPALADDEQRSRHKGVHHIAFEYTTLDDLLAAYAIEIARN